ncbi:hypothetical protein EV651_114104 [Kribbella sp. VKM Ac-2571]|nr:hypothetical protein EV651_114104 [Kribbella sp. VKM Ac-2571]
MLQTAPSQPVWSGSTPPEDTPWSRRTFTLVLPEGHCLTISGPCSQLRKS